MGLDLGNDITSGIAADVLGRFYFAGCWEEVCIEKELFHRKKLGSTSRHRLYEGKKEDAS